MLITQTSKGKTSCAVCPTRLIEKVTKIFMISAHSICVLSQKMS